MWIMKKLIKFAVKSFADINILYSVCLLARNEETLNFKLN